MKKFSLILIFFSIFSSYSQNEKIADFVNKTFFGYDIMTKPDIIESPSYRPIDYGPRYDEKNIKEFKSHPLVREEIVGGEYNILYAFRESKDLFEDYGVYKLEMTIGFKNYKSAKDMLEKLKKTCRLSAEYKSETEGRENAPKSEKCTYRFDQKLELPIIKLNYQRGPHTINIEVYTSYDFKKFKKFKRVLGIIH